MEKLIINNQNDNQYDSKMEKARALLFDEFGNIYVCDMNGSLMLPGGTVEDGDTNEVTIDRELKEELGVTGIYLHPLIQIEYYHDGFPKYKQEGYDRRLNTVTYYFSSVPVEIDLDSSELTEYEKENKAKISKYSIEELLEKINAPSDNKWKKFTSLELLTILRIAQKRGIIPSEKPKSK